jgi:hypothetical protein
MHTWSHRHRSRWGYLPPHGQPHHRPQKPRLVKGQLHSAGLHQHGQRTVQTHSPSRLRRLLQLPSGPQQPLETTPMDQPLAQHPYWPPPVQVYGSQDKLHSTRAQHSTHQLHLLMYDYSAGVAAHGIQTYQNARVWRLQGLLSHSPCRPQHICPLQSTFSAGPVERWEQMCHIVRASNSARPLSQSSVGHSLAQTTHTQRDTTRTSLPWRGLLSATRRDPLLHTLALQPHALQLHRLRPALPQQPGPVVIPHSSPQPLAPPPTVSTRRKPLQVSLLPKTLPTAHDKCSALCRAPTC